MSTLVNDFRVNYNKIMSDARQLFIRDMPFKGKSVVYVMSRDQRVQDNHALILAQKLAIANKVPLYVLFVLKIVKPRSYEHYEFMLDGLLEVVRSTSKHNISFVIRAGYGATEITKFVQEVGCGALFFDFNPLKHARLIIEKVASRVDIQMSAVDTHNIIPVWVASNKQEFAAHTMRRKVHQNLEKFLVVPPPLQKHPHSAEPVASMSIDDALQFISKIPKSGIKLSQKSGEIAAREHLKTFINSSLEKYALQRNNIEHDYQSGLSPYLHFGQISSLRVAVETISHVNQTPLLFQYNKLAQSSGVHSSLDGMNALFEEMIVRKELSDNFCFYSEHYKSLDGAPAWAQSSLAEHEVDVREFTYNLHEWEAAKTHDNIWNTAQMELTKTGKMHGYMRMYWAKKILEWSSSPAEAINTAIYLNDKYSIDGGDPNGYVGILWSIAGLHDRPWFERSIFGKIRYMNESGLRRKFLVDDYIKRIDAL